MNNIKTLFLLFTVLSFISAMCSKGFAEENITSKNQLYKKLTTSSSSTEPSSIISRCGTKTKPPSLIPRKHTTGLPSEDCTLEQTIIKDNYFSPVALVIPLYFHVIFKSDGTGNISDQAIHDQIEALNEDFRAIPGTLGSESYDTMIQFKLEAITRTQNDNWFNDKNEIEYKNELAQNQNRTINIYSNSASGYLGYSYFPQDYAGTVLDGIVLLYKAVGGRNNGSSFYNQGRTLVHEMGHYLGLEHTFENGSNCSNSYTSGDLIVDTNAELEEHYGCTQTYSCGLEDPIHNFMNYTDDSCMSNFTREQANRMVCSLMTYRPELYKIFRVDMTGPNLLLLSD